MSDVINKATPRINSTLLSKYRNEVVRLIGRVKESSKNSAVLEASDKGQIRILLSPETILQANKIVEIIGRVRDDHSLQELNTTNFGEEFDLDLYENAVQVAQKYSKLFF
ncbi:hypothetical protein Glove_112g44 [Diversispora epigaea]|uniref:Replication factor A protein 3 n=1 Tax=Diversispora epigaea TaxID=1348612 RepID=A0A397JB33_9GLOM|nr:hypothetical protein Glove_112g44 [Diversispora epigaea]